MSPRTRSFCSLESRWSPGVTRALGVPAEASVTRHRERNDERSRHLSVSFQRSARWFSAAMPELLQPRGADRKSTRLNSSHLVISYAVFCLKKKKAKRKTRLT